jgi:hypothetical protein
VHCGSSLGNSVCRGNDHIHNGQSTEQLMLKQFATQLLLLADWLPLNTDCEV